MSPPAEGSPMETILVADDAPDVLFLARDILQAQGYTVLTANDGGGSPAACRGLRGADPRPARRRKVREALDYRAPPPLPNHGPARRPSGYVKRGSERI